MTSLLFTVEGAVVNALAFSGTNFVLSRLTDHGEEEHKRHELALEKLQRARDEWNEDRMKRIDFINKRLCEKMRQRYISTMLMKQCLNTIAYLQKKLKHSSPEPELSDFYRPSETQKMVNYYLLPWVQALQHIPCTSTLNK